ncbi:binary toxin-like calcium binding domain-containing protein, partial [Vallitalea sediminicola]
MNKNDTATKLTKNKFLSEIFIILIILQMIFLPTSSFAETISSNNLPTDTLLSSSTHEDSDDDGISDYLELHGYMIDNENNIVPWDGNENNKYHKSDPNSASTTGDPYDDRSKLAGSGLHSPIDSIAKNNP